MPAAVQAAAVLVIQESLLTRSFRRNIGFIGMSNDRGSTAAALLAAVYGVPIFRYDLVREFSTDYYPADYYSLATTRVGPVLVTKRNPKPCPMWQGFLFA